MIVEKGLDEALNAISFNFSIYFLALEERE